MTRPQRALHPETQRKANDLGARLKAARMRRGMSQAEMAARVLVSRPTLHRLESGDLTVSAVTLVRVLDILALVGDVDLIAAHDDLGHQMADARLPRPYGAPSRGLADEL
jgi:transcriptional regulator with XRE-family HTH domain